MNPIDIEQTVLYDLKNNIRKPPNYDLPDLLLYLTLYQIYYMFRNNIIERQEGSQLKNIALEKHKLFSFYNDLFAETAKMRTELSKQLTELRDIELHGCEHCQTVLKLFDGRIKS